MANADLLCLEDGPALAVTPTSPWMSKEVWGLRRSSTTESLESTLAQFDDQTVADDSVIFLSKPLTAGLRRKRWQCFTHCCGWGYFLIALAYAMRQASSGVCGPVRMMEFMLVVLYILAALWGWSSPYLARRIGTSRWLTVCGVLEFFRAVTSFLVASQQVAVLAGVEADNYRCSMAELVSQLVKHYLFSLWSFAFSYVLLRGERHFLNFVGFTSVYVVLLAATDAMTGTWSAFSLVSEVFVFNLCCFSWAISRYLMRQRKLAAKLAVRADELAYATMWDALLSDQLCSASVHSLAACAAEIRCGLGDNKARQATNSLDLLFVEATLISTPFRNFLHTLASETGGLHVPAHVKSQRRALEKLRRVYSDDASYLVDLVRGSIVYNSIAEIEAGLRALADKAKVVRLKNRFDPSYCASASAGYRDVSVNIEFSGLPGARSLICEVQLQHQDLYALKTDGGHSRYVAFRNLCGS
eukprot:TRINITY_DN46591_c0_g1_i1.p1 TRINITY_DN46591_c0_g1~~TRINITY_DN46591_c0_g1_i1.p1  ORF type:complete len:471 (+),score=29.21 TRINITY_DN46591_c0_g1_i1:33-1445(+)